MFRPHPLTTGQEKWAEIIRWMETVVEADVSNLTDAQSEEDLSPYGGDDRARLAHGLLLTQMLLDNWLRPWVRRERLGLSPSLTMVLYTIRDEPTPTLRHLAERLDVTPTAITSITDRLESLGYVRRVRTPGDRRRTQLEITEAGRDISIQIEESFVRDIQAALAVWDSGRLELVREATETLNGFVTDLNRVTPKLPTTDD